MYSYAPDEDDMVTDPLLARHLAHWSINMMQVVFADKLTNKALKPQCQRQRQPYMPPSTCRICRRTLGLNISASIAQMEKTEKTMAELEIDQNIKFEWDSITESGSALKPLSGPGCACNSFDVLRLYRPSLPSFLRVCHPSVMSKCCKSFLDKCYQT